MLNDKLLELRRVRDKHDAAVFRLVAGFDDCVPDTNPPRWRSVPADTRPTLSRTGNTASTGVSARRPPVFQPASQWHRSQMPEEQRTNSPWPFVRRRRGSKYRQIDAESARSGDDKPPGPLSAQARALESDRLRDKSA